MNAFRSSLYEAGQLSAGKNLLTDLPNSADLFCATVDENSSEQCHLLANSVDLLHIEV